MDEVARGALTGDDADEPDVLDDPGRLSGEVLQRPSDLGWLAWRAT
jgi:hypothetical protein